MNLTKDIESFLSQEQKDLVALLRRGQENARSPKYLRERLFVSDRTLRYLVEKTRQYVPILSSTKTGGYYLPDKGDKGLREARRFVSSQESIAKSCFASCKAVKSFLNEGSGQMTFDA